MIVLTPARRVMLKTAGICAAGLLAFVFALHYTFPYDRVRDKVVEALSDRYDVTIESAGPGFFPGHMKIHGMTLATRTESEDEKPTVLEIASLDISLGMFALLAGDTEVDFDAEVGDGEVSGRVRVGEEALVIDVETHGLPLETVPGVEMIAGGAPLKGLLDADVSLRLPKQKWRDAEGSIRLACEKCVMGDGKTKMRPSAGKARNAFSEGGFTLDPTRLGTLEGRITIEKGVACIDELTSSSPDGELTIEGGIKFDDPFARSQAQLYARFKVSDDFKSKNERMAAVVNGIPPKGRRSDGFFGYAARDALGSLGWRPAQENPAPMRECGAGGGSALAEKKDKPRKPPTRRELPATGAEAEEKDKGMLLEREGAPSVTPIGGREDGPPIRMPSDLVRTADAAIERAEPAPSPPEKPEETEPVIEEQPAGPENDQPQPSHGGDEGGQGNEQVQ